MINIQEQFQVNISLPVDSRIVASGSAARSAIAYKYDGLVVYDTSDRKTYAWNADTSQWTDTSASGGSGVVNTLSKWFSAGGLTSSSVYYIDVTASTGKIGINTSDPKGELQINPHSSSSQPIVFSQTGFFNIISSNWYNDGSDQVFNSGVGSAAILFKGDGGIQFSNRLANTTATLNQIGVFSTTIIEFNKDVVLCTSFPPTTSVFLRATNGFSSSTNPEYTWYNDAGTGIYHPASNRIGFSIAGVQKGILTSTGLLLSNTANITAPNYRLHLDSGNSTQNYLQFTNGTTTGTSGTNGFRLGINSFGWPNLLSGDVSGDNKPILFSFGNFTYHSVKKYKIVSVATEFGVGHPSLNQPNGGAFSRVERISIENDKLVNNTTNVVYDLEVPSGYYVSIDATFTTWLRYNSTTYQARTNKVFALFVTNSVGVVTTVSQVAQTSLPNISTTAANAVVAGTVTPHASLNNKISFNQAIFLQTSGTFNQASVVLEIKAVFNSAAT
jgi:hypothetical protein